MKRTKRKNVTFTDEQWKKVKDKAFWTDLTTTAVIRNLSLYRQWKSIKGYNIGNHMRDINRIGTDLGMILRVAETPIPNIPTS